VYAQINRGLWIEYAQGIIDRSTLHRRRFQESFEALGIDGELYEYAGSIYMEYYRTHWEWMKGAKQAFLTLHEYYEMGVITNGFAETQRMKIQQFEFDKLCSNIIISEEFGVMKPDPAIFNKATQQAGYAPEQILYVGDSLSSDVDGALNAGWNMAWYNPKNLPSEGREPHLNFQDFQELIDVLG
jgi:putative hydrolase of the HAD superfamily